MRKRIRRNLLEPLDQRFHFAGNGLRAEYFADETLSNRAVLRTDATIDFDWGQGSPDAAVAADHFSARWTGKVQATTTGAYTFATQSDDGVRLWVNNTLLIDHWAPHGVATDTATIVLSAGQQYDLKLEYHEATVGAVSRLLWTPPSSAQQVIPTSALYAAGETGLRGEYFSNTTLSGASVVRRDANIDFDWSASSPDGSLARTMYSVRWTGQVKPSYSQTYTFTTQSDDGVRLWVNGQQIIDNWTDHALTSNTGTITLVAGQSYDIRVEYYNKTGGATARMFWSSASQVQQVVPASALSTPLAGGVSVVANGMQVVVEVAGDDVFKISASKAPSGAANTTSAAELVSGTARFRFDPSLGTFSISRDRTTIWSGNIRGLSTFGRASVPGSEVDWAASAGEVLFGLGERFDSLNQWGKLVNLYIEDAPGQGDGGKTYYATPVLYSNKGYALFATDNPESQFDLNSTGDGYNRYRRASPSAQFYIAAGDDLAELIKKRTAIQGTSGTVPDWSFGPWISKNSYETQAEAMAALQGNFDRGNPVSAIVQEAWKGSDDHFNDFNGWNWPDLNAYFDYARAHDVHTVLWQVPIWNPNSPSFASLAAKQFFVRRPDGSVSLRDEWLAGQANVDFTNPAAVAWWKDTMRDEVRQGVFGFKADDGESIKPDDVFFDGRRGWQMHNEYAKLYDQALGELLQEELGDQGLLWARSGSLGSEKYPGLWAGDQASEWYSLRRLVSAGLSSGVSGQPFWGHDIGGYFGTPSAELYERWTAFGALSPFMQYHGQNGREPWLFGDQAQAIYKKMAMLRMNLQPTLIALGKEASATGIPIMRPMALQYPGEARFAYEDQQYMLGADMLVAPVMDAGVTGRTVKFPSGSRWVMALTGRIYDGGTEQFVPISVDQAPLFFREGAAVATQTAGGNWLDQYVAGQPLTMLKVQSPTFLSAAFVANNRTDLIFRFDQDLAVRPAIADLVVRNKSTGQLVAPLSTSYDATNDAVLFTLPANMPVGDYSATLNYGAAKNAIGLNARGQTTLNFSFLGDVAPPIVVTPAAAATNPTAGSSIALSVLGNDDRGESSLTYAWSIVGNPDGTVTFSTNGTNAAKNVTALVTRPGNYTFLVTITDVAGNTVTSSVTVAASFGLLTGTQDIGSPARVGSLTHSTTTNTYTLTGAGTDIEGTADQFRFAFRTFAGDGSIIAKVTSLTNTDPWAKAGVMLRADSSAGSIFADVVVTAEHGLAFQWRSLESGNTNGVIIAGPATPTWVKLTRIATAVAGYYSADGITWTQIGATQTLAFGASPLGGLALTAHTNASLATATFAGVSVLPAGWASTDIGFPSIVGSGVYDVAADTWAMTGGGADIWSTADQFQFAGQPLVEDGDFVARLASQSAVGPWAKAGVMMRGGLGANAAYAALLVTPSNGINFQWRSAAGGNSFNAVINGNAPQWLRLHRDGDVVTAYVSSDGTTWTVVGSPKTIALGATPQAGLAVSSHSTTTACTATFDHVALAPAVRPRVSSYAVNAGAAQRSMVTSLRVTFDRAVSLAAGALTLTRRSSTGGTGVPLTLTDNGGGVYTLTFSGTGGSLADGIYDLKVTGTAVRSTAGWAMNGDGAFTFHRLFGDVTGEGTVNNADYGRFTRAYGSVFSHATYVTAFDFDADGLINNLDYGQFSRRFGTSYLY